MEGSSQQSEEVLVLWNEEANRCERCPSRSLSFILSSDDVLRDLVIDILKIFAYAGSLYFTDLLKHIWEGNLPWQFSLFVFIVELSTFLSLIYHCLQIIDKCLKTIKNMLNP